MRTERLRTALLLGTLLVPVALATPAGSQQAEVVEAVPAPPAPPAPGLDDSSGAVITGDYTVRTGESVDGLVVVGGDLHVAIRFRFALRGQR